MTKNQKLNEEEMTFEIGSHNIFADILIPNPEEELLKAELTFAIHQIIKKRKLTQTKLAKILRTDQGEIFALLHRELDGFSTFRLMHFLNQLGQNIEIIIKQKLPGQKTSSITVLKQY